MTPRDNVNCTWQHDCSYESDIWETSCGEAVVFEEFAPAECGYKFCQYCGKPISFVDLEDDLLDPDGDA